MFFKDTKKILGILIIISSLKALGGSSEFPNKLPYYTILPEKKRIPKMTYLIRSRQ